MLNPNPYAIFLNDRNNPTDKILHTQLIFYHLPIIAIILKMLFLVLQYKSNFLDLYNTIVYLVFAIFAYPSSYKLRFSGWIARIKHQQVDDVSKNRISVLLILGIIETSVIIFTVANSLVFLTLCLYESEIAFQNTPNSIRSISDAYETAFNAIDIKGMTNFELHSFTSKMITSFMWGIGTVIPAIVIGFWLKAFEGIFISFKLPEDD